ncbi:MAG: FCD domain-containing protein [Synergistales bacterium]|nr:FCD domain-containing protein [Synergistales bacterium]
MDELTQQEFETLQVLKASKAPIGAGALQAALAGKKRKVSIATAGRILWELEQKGFARREGNRGRRLTDAGSEKLRELQSLSERNSLAQELLDRLNTRGPKKILDSLVARRAIERECARLAALQADSEDITEIRSFVELLNGQEDEDRITFLDRKFHEAVAKAGKNLILLASMRLVRQDGELQQAIAHIRRFGSTRIGGDHGPILQAIIQRNPEGAEQAMLRHIDNLASDVEHHYRRAEELGDGTPRVIPR